MARFTGMPDAWSVWRTSNRGAQSQGLNEIDSNLLEFFSENLNCAPKILISPTFVSGKTSFED